MAYLVFGFALQFVGYSLEIGGSSMKTDGDRLPTAWGMAAVVFLIALVGWRIFSPRRAAWLSAGIEHEGPDVSRRSVERESA